MNTLERVNHDNSEKFITMLKALSSHEDARGVLQDIKQEYYSQKTDHLSEAIFTLIEDIAYRDEKGMSKDDKQDIINERNHDRLAESVNTLSGAVMSLINTLSNMKGVNA